MEPQIKWKDVSSLSIEKLKVTQYIPPKGDYEIFQDENHFKEKLKEWGLPVAKKEFWYKDRNFQCHVTIKGYETYGNNNNTLIIEFPNGEISCIHPAYLKEMQQASFGKESMILAEDKPKIMDESEVKITKSSAKVQKERRAETSQTEKTSYSKEKEQSQKIDLPSGKVHFTATVKQFALTYNPFSEENDEVVVLKNVQIEQENPLELGLAWCSHSKTLKKFELAKGDQLEFDGKVVAKKLAKGKDVPDEYIVEAPVLYKINNPSKIVKK